MKFEVATYFLHVFYSGPLCFDLLSLKIKMRFVFNLGLKGFNQAKTKFEDQIKYLEKLNYFNPQWFFR
jgi:hypothetical protein